MTPSPIIAQKIEDLIPEYLKNQLEQLKAENEVYKEALLAVHAQCINGRLFTKVADPTGMLWHTKVTNALKFVFTPKNEKNKK